MEASYHLLHNKENSATNSTDASNGANLANEYENVMCKIKRKLIIDTCNGISEKTKVLSLHTKPVDPLEADSNLKMLYNSAVSNCKKVKSARVTFKQHLIVSWTLLISEMTTVFNLTFIQS